MVWRRKLMGFLGIPTALFWKTMAVIAVILFLAYAYHIGGPSDVTRESIKQYGEYLQGNSPYIGGNRQTQPVQGGLPGNAVAPDSANTMQNQVQPKKPVNPANIPPVYTKPAATGTVTGKTYSRR